MATKGKPSEVGSDAPLESSKKNVSNLVDDVLGTPAPSTQRFSPGPKSTLPKEDPGLKEDDSEIPAEEESTTDQPSQETDTASEESEETEDSTAEPEGESADEEEVVPASKHKKTLEKMQQRIDQLTNKIKAQEAKEATEAKTQEQKLQNLSGDELTELRDNVDEAIIDAKVSQKTEGVDNASRIQELRQLRRQIDKTVADSPKRFMAKQVEHLNSMMETVKDVDPDVLSRKGDLWNAAQRVYQRMPSLQSSETGMAEAMAIATEYILERKQVSDGREKASTLSKKVANLKRKTTLASKVRDADQAQVSFKKLRDRAVGGTFSDKHEFFKQLVPDEFLQRPV